MGKLFSFFVNKEAVTVENKDGTSKEKTKYSLTAKGKAIWQMVIDTFLVIITAIFAVFFLGLAIEIAAYMMAAYIVITYLLETYRNIRTLVSSSEDTAAPAAEAAVVVDDEEAAATA